MRWKLTGLLLSAWIVLFTVSLIFIYQDYKVFIIEKLTSNLNVVSQLISDRISSETFNLKSSISFFSLYNHAIREAVEASNASYGGKSEKQYMDEIKKIDDSWSESGWEKLKKDLLNNNASFALKDLIGVNRFPLAEVFVTDEKGALVAATRKTSDYYQADELWWQRAYNGGKDSLYLSAMEYDESSRVNSFSIASPVIDEKDNVIGVMKTVVNKDKIFSDIFNIFLGDGSYAGLMSSVGANIFNLNYSVQGDKKFLKPLFDYLVLRKGKGDNIIRLPDGRRFIVGYSKVSGGIFGEARDWYVYCLQDISQLFEQFEKVFWKLFFIWLAITIFFYGIIFLIARTIVDPINKLRDGFDYLKKGSFGNKVEIRSGDEIQDLAVDFNNMVEDLRKSTVSRDYFDKIIQSMSDMLFVVDSYGTIALVNKRTCELLEYSEAELKGKLATDIFSKKDRYIVNWGVKGIIEEGDLKDKRIKLLTKSRREIEVYLGTRSLRDKEGNLLGIVCLAKDLTEINKLLGELEISYREISKHKQELENSLKDVTEGRDVMLSILEDTNEAKKTLEETLKKLTDTQAELLQAEKLASLGQIAAGVAHEINNPLFVISGEAEMLELDKKLPDSVMDSIRIIREQVVRIGDITKRLLEFSKKREPRMAQVDVNSLVLKTIDLLRYQAQLISNIEIVTDLSKEPVFVKGDETQLQEVLLNLMLNGIQAMQDTAGTLTIRTFSEIIRNSSLAQEGPFKYADKVVCIEISDTGCGMDDITRAKIFDPFFTTKKTGTGLGLCVCFGIIERHNGVIEVDSQLNIGSKFTVKLPFSANNPQ